jgi:hypothetical protein
VLYVLLRPKGSFYKHSDEPTDRYKLKIRYIRSTIGLGSLGITSVGHALCLEGSDDELWPVSRNFTVFIWHGRIYLHICRIVTMLVVVLEEVLAWCLALPLAWLQNFPCPP